MSDVTPIRWGIIGTGGIATAFATDLALMPDASLVAVGSRSQGTADEFGERFDVPHRHATYAGLVNDADVDAVYVSTPHPGHHDAALSAINAGKAVLVEKPFTMTANEASSLIDAARSHGVFLMEAMWARLLPHMVRVRELLASRALGDVRVVIADHNQWFAARPRLPPVRPGAGRRRAARPRHLPGVLRVDGLRRADPGDGRVGPRVHGCRRDDVGDLAVRGRCALRADHVPGSRRPEPRGDRRHRGPHRDRLGVLRADHFHAHRPATARCRNVSTSRRRGSRDAARGRGGHAVHARRTAARATSCRCTRPSPSWRRSTRSAARSGWSTRASDQRPAELS